MNVNFFNTSIEEFIATLEKQTIQRVLRLIDLLEKYGPRLTMPHSKNIGLHLFELRIRGRQEIRLFYTFHRSQIVILHGFVKKTQRIPRAELGIARRRLRSIDNI